MQVPEKLAMIGGSILLSSTLIFTLKSQASNILPKVEHPISNIYNHVGDAQKASEFDDSFKQAQKKGWTTGHWGTAPYYIDEQENMYVGSGKLSGSFYNLDNTSYLKTINLDKPVQAPQNSDRLFGIYLGGVNHTLTSINGLDNLDTSQVTNMYSMFCEDQSLNYLDVSHFNTSHVTNMGYMFGADGKIHDLDISHFDTSNVANFSGIFMGAQINNLDLSHWNTSKANNIGFAYDNNIKQLILGRDTRLADSNLWDCIYKNKNDNQVLNTKQLADNQPHPGTWILQR